MAATILDLIELRSFSSIWYWLLVGAVWTRVMNAPLGVPVHLVRRAARRGPGACADLHAATRIEVAQRRALHRALGAWQVAGWCALLSGLATLAAGYRMEFAEAALLLLAPLALVRLLGDRAAAALAAAPVDDAALVAAHERLRRRVQAVGLVAVFATAVWGMSHNLAAPFP